MKPSVRTRYLFYIADIVGSSTYMWLQSAVHSLFKAGQTPKQCILEYTLALFLLLQIDLSFAKLLSSLRRFMSGMHIQG